MKLQCPIKEGIKVKKWYAKNTPLNSLYDFTLCISQGFGENQRLYEELGLAGHNGLDIVYEHRTEVFASHDGTATFTKDDKEGLGIVILGEGFKTIYWHLDSAVNSLGSSWQVKKGDLIGWGDNTGWSTGTHLHYGLKFLNNDGSIKDYNNGYFGAQDATPFLIWWEEGGDTMDRDFIIYYYLSAFNRLPEQSEIDYWFNKPHIEIVKATVRDREKLLESNMPK